MVWYEHLVEGDIHTACPLESHHIPVVAEGHVINADSSEPRRGVLLRLDSRKKKPFSMGGATGVPIMPTQFDTTVDDAEGARRRRNCAEKWHGTGSKDGFDSCVAQLCSTDARCACMVKACPSRSGVCVTKSLEVAQLRCHQQFIATNL